jgi:hypothetical protein
MFCIEILQYVAMSYKNEDNELDIEKWSDSECIINEYVSNLITDGKIENFFRNFFLQIYNNNN